MLHLPTGTDLTAILAEVFFLTTHAVLLMAGVQVGQPST